jgi:hypothetical protein
MVQTGWNLRTCLESWRVTWKDSSLEGSGRSYKYADLEKHVI